jgi:Spy/CpxP family protein refolding chaperone
MSGLIKLAGSPKVQGAALLVLVFVVGALVGGAVERVRMAQTRPDPPRFDREKPPFPEGAEAPWAERGVVPRPFERLDLTDQQRERIVEILESSRPVTDSIMMETMPRLIEVRDSIAAEIREVLTAEQLEQLDREMGERFMRPNMFMRPMGRPGLPDSTRRTPGSHALALPASLARCRARLSARQLSSGDR